MRAISEFTSHRYPSVTRVQYSSLRATMAGFVFFMGDPKQPDIAIGLLIDEAIAQNARFFRPEPTRIFSFEFSDRDAFKCFEFIPLSEQEFKIRRILSPRRRLVNAAKEIADRHFYMVED